MAKKLKKKRKTPKPTKKVPTKKVKKVVATEKVKKYPINQFEDMSGWLEYYKLNNKFPHARIICGKCQSDFASLKGLGSKVAFDRCENDPSRVLKETLCKDCRSLEPKIKKVKVYTKEELEDRAEEIRRNLPKIDFNKERVVIDLVKNKDACIEHTKYACLRPDVYLDNDRTCDTCTIRKWCSCPIKKFSKSYGK